MIPEGWKNTHLIELVEGQIKNGYSPNAVDYLTGYWVLGLGALGEDGFNKEEIKSVECTKKVRGTLLACDDFLVSRSNTPNKVGRAARYKGELSNCSYPDLMMRFRIDPKKADLDYLEQKIRSLSIRKYYRSCAAGSSSTMVKINKSVVEKTPIQLPPLIEQKKIAKILSTWDKAISTTQALIDTSKQQKNALMQQLLTGKKRFTEFSEEWSTVQLGKISSISTGSSNRQDSHLNGEYAFFDRSEDIRTSDQYLYDGEAVIVPGEGQYFIPKYFTGKFDLHQRTYAIMNFVSSDAKFMYYAITQFRNYFLSQAVGSTVKSLRLPMFKKMKLNIPVLAEQQSVASVLSVADKEIETFQQKLDYLKQEKKALMQQLLTGKRRVKTDEDDLRGDVA